MEKETSKKDGVWQTRGRRFKKLVGNDPEPKPVGCKAGIFVQEDDRSVDMDLPWPPKNASAGKKKPKTPYGVPVDFKLAVGLIASLQKDLHDKFEFLKKLKLDSSDFEKTSEFDETIEDLKKIMIRSSAITIDKNILLKTLSQPGCEGLRFYLCKKSVPEEGNNERYVSLVTVGVDKFGADLKYEYPEKEDERQEMFKTLAKADSSLTSEYGHPPPNSNVKDLKFTNFDRRFALYKYAIDEMKHLKP